MIVSGYTQFKRGRQYEGNLRGLWGLSLTLAGRGIYRHPKGELISRHGDLVLIEPLVPVAWRVPADVAAWRTVFFKFTPTASLLPRLRLPSVSEGYRYYSIAKPFVFRRVRQALLKAHGYAVLHRPSYEPLVFNAIEEALLWCQTEADDARSPCDPRVDAAVHFLSSHMNRPLRIREVARACGTSRTRLLTLFRAQMGLPLMQYLEQQRMVRAQGLLKTGMMRVKEVALEVGYADQKYFAKRFKRAFAQRPTDCRH
jgi:AraC family transcriptional regulator, arabinose operon regulatory protein